MYDPTLPVERMFFLDTLYKVLDQRNGEEKILEGGDFNLVENDT